MILKVVRWIAQSFMAGVFLILLMMLSNYLNPRMLRDDYLKCLMRGQPSSLALEGSKAP